MIISTEHAGGALGNQLTFVQAEDGTFYVPLKRLCETLKIDYEGQRSKVSNSEELHTELLSVPGTDGRKRKMLCLPADAVGDWASTIDPRTLKPEVVEALSGYLEEPDETLQGCEETSDSPRLLLITSEKLAELAVDAAEGIVKRILGNDLLPKLSALRQIRIQMLQREIDFIEDVATDSPEVRAKAQTYIEDAKAQYAAWLVDFERSVSPGPIH
jgi:hypothetical protein